jgi:glycosyltransferase involved in cell wall biosynthesis
MSRPWLVFQEGPRRRWGGDLRRAFIFRDLAVRTGATIVEGYAPRLVQSAVSTARGRRYGLLPGRRPLVASSETLAWATVKAIERNAVPVALDVHDDPVAQHRALGASAAPARLEDLARRMRANTSAFRVLVAPSETFADLAGLDPDRRVVASNGTDPRHILVRPMPSRPAVGLVSGAAPGRGIETLIDATRAVRDQVRDVVLLLWLVTTGEAAERYLRSLVEAAVDEPWIQVGTAPYDTLGDELARATVLAVPHPPDAYMDSALPVKLFDSMAAGRPVVVTPRVEMAEVVRRHGAGLVAASDRADDLAEAILRLIEDPDLSARLGAAGRAAAEERFDWQIIARDVATAVLSRTPEARPDMFG